MPEELNWTDYAQAISAMVAIPGAIVAFVILFRKDKAREAEIKSLADIAGQMTKLMQISEARYKDSKKPFIKVKSSGFKPGTGYIKLDFINSNNQSTIKSFECLPVKPEVKLEIYVIQTIDGRQGFGFDCVSIKPDPEVYVFDMEYLTEDGFTFVQQIMAIPSKASGKFNCLCGVITEKGEASTDS